MTTEIFNRALKAHQLGDLNSAQAYYKKFLSVAPREPNALQLLGVVLHAKGDNESALKYMQASLKIKPDQPQVMLNVATCQRQLRQYDAALATLHQLIKRDSANFAAFKCKMYVLVEMENFAQAYNELNRQINRFPGHYELYNLLGAVASECDDYPKAIKAYEKAIAIRPGSDVTRHNLGLAYRFSGEPEKALKEYLIVLNSGKHSYQLMHNLGNAYSDIGHLEQAVTYFHNALKLNYGYLDSHINLNDVLWELGNRKQYLQSFKKAMSLFPEDPAFLFQYARRLCRLSQYEAMRECLDKGKSRFSELPEYKYLIAKAHVKTGEKVKGLETLKTLANNSQLSTEDHLDICKILLEQNEFAKAEKSISEILRVDPKNVAALAYWGLCLRHNADFKETHLNDYDNLIKEYTLFNVEKELLFYSELVDTLTRLHVSNEQPLNQALMNGTQTRGLLFASNNPVIKKLVERVKRSISNYIEQIQPLNSRWLNLPDKQDVKFSGSWSVRLKSGGYHANHFHPMGKLSSVAFISIPKVISDTRNYDGYLKFGEPNLSSKHQFSAQRYVKPEAGKLILFPSYYWHGTEPFIDDTDRLTIAFDIT